MVKEAAPASQMVLVGNILFDTYCKCQHISEAEWGYSEEPILDTTAPPPPQHRQEVHHGGWTTLVVTQGQSVSPYFQINISWTKNTTQVKSKLLHKHSYNCFSFLTLGNHSILLFSFNFFLIDNSRPQLKAP